MTSSSTPESLGLQHLAIRPKKQQLIEDQRQKVAKENAKLMSGMTKVCRSSSYYSYQYESVYLSLFFMSQIMNEKRAQTKHDMPPSLNEVERKKEVDRMNFENNLMLSRLNNIAPTLSRAKFAEDFKKHLHAEANLRKRQMKPLSLPKDMHRVKERSSLFDSSTYASQHDTFGKGASVLQEEFDSPIQSMKEFREQVIASKKRSALSHSGSSVLMSQGGAGRDSSAGGSTVLRSQREISVHRNEALFEMEHEPSY